MKKNLMFLTLISLFSSFNLNSEILTPQEAFFKAVDNNDIESIKKAIAEGADINELNANTNTTALFQALLKLNEYTNTKHKWIFHAGGSTVFSIITLALLADSEPEVAVAAASGFLAIYLSCLTHKMRTRLEKTATTVNTLLTYPQIKIDKNSTKLLNKIISNSSEKIKNLLKIPQENNNE